MITGSGSFSVLQKKITKIVLCKLQICMKIKKNVKGEKNMLNHLLRLIRAVLAEIIGTFLRKTMLA